MSPYDEQNKDSTDKSPVTANQREGAAIKGTPHDPDFTDEQNAVNNTALNNSGFSYSPGKDRKSKYSILNNLRGSAGTKKGLFIGVGGGLAGILMIVGILGGFLNSFQLDGLMSNIEANTHARLMADTDNRSSKFIQAYMAARLSEVEPSRSTNIDGADREVLLFKSERVDKNNPTTDWYRTLRANKFEEKIFNSKGISFKGAAVNENGKTVFRGASITINDVEITPENQAAIKDAIDRNDIPKLQNELKQFVNIQVYNNNIEARRAIRNAVNDEIKPWQVFKRRHIRADIQNRTGVTKWRFFEKTRDKINDKQTTIRNRFITQALPENTKAGKIVQCVFGILPTSQCRGGDPADPNTRSENLDLPDTENITRELSGDTVDGEGKVTKEVISVSVNTKIVEEVIKKAVPGLNAVNMVATFDMISAGIDGLKNLPGMISSYKATQAIGVFSTLMIARDQIKSGEVVGEEVNDLMAMVSNGTNSEGWTKVIAKTPTVSAAEQTDQLQNPQTTDEFCSDSYQEKLHDPKNAAKASMVYVPLCPSKQIGGLSGAAAWIANFMNSPIGKVLVGISSVWKGFTNNIAFDVIRSGLAAVDSAISTIIKPVLDASGISATTDEFAKKGIAAISEQVSLVPLANENSTPGEIINIGIEGGAASAESSMRLNGAPKTTQEARTRAVDTVALYTKESSASQSLVNKYISLDNYKSITSRTLASALQDKRKIANVIASAPTNIFSRFFTAGAKADTDSYAAASFAGIDTYDMPAVCMDMDPFSMNLENATNITKIYPEIKQSEITWDLLRDKQNFYAFLYAKAAEDKSIDINNLGSVSEKAMQVYNCALFDRSVAGSLGAEYGYTDDGGLESTSETTTTDGTDPGSSAGPNASSQEILDQCKNGTAAGKVKIVCSSLTLAGIPYGATGTAGHLTQNPSVIGCNSYANISIMRATDGKYRGEYCSQYFGTQGVSDKKFKKIPLTEIQPGDFVVRESSCGCTAECGGNADSQGRFGHIAIVVSYDKSTDKLVASEASSSSKPSGISDVSTATWSPDNKYGFTYGLVYVGGGL